MTHRPESCDIVAQSAFSSLTGRMLFVIGQPVALSQTSSFIGHLDPTDPELESAPGGPAQLKSDLDTFSPNCVLVLGREAFADAMPKAKLDHWRGSIFTCTNIHSPLYGRKCVATWHPKDVARDYTKFQVTRFDILKAVRESQTTGFEPPKREVEIITSVPALSAAITTLRSSRQKVSTDIEGGINTMSCISFATTPSFAYVLPFIKSDGSPAWTEEEEIEVWKLLVPFLHDTNVPKVLQNSLYDLFVLAYSYRVLVRSVVDDTMLKHWELLCELEKGLAFQASIYTNEPYYKGDRKSGDFDTFLRYNGKDSMVTSEINNVLEDSIVKQPNAQTHYQLNTLLLRPLLYMELRGLKYDLNEAHNKRVATDLELAGHQNQLDLVAGRPMNIRSPVFKKYLYEELKLPTQFAKNPKTKLMVPSTNYESLLKLRRHSQHPAITQALRITRLRTLRQMLNISADPDGRIRCGYNVVGTETGRLSSYTSPTGSGYNLQTLPQEDAAQDENSVLFSGLRTLCIADDDCEIFQCDLKGADGWTVAARCASLGDSTMLDDYLYGLAPAKILAQMTRDGAHWANASRAELKEACKTIKKSDWRYFVAKQGQHGSNYLMGPTTLSRRIFIESDGEVLLSVADCERIQQFYFMRYRGVRLWHNWAQQQLKTKRTTQASGHSRIYFGRSTETLGQALADEPQGNTTYVTNLALLRLWTDPTNRRSDGSLLVEPLHQVHDALVGQWRKCDREYALASIPRWFNNPIRIGSIIVKIPFEGLYGTSWGNLTEEIRN